MSTLSERVILSFTHRNWRALVAAAVVLTTVPDAAAQVTITWDPSPEPDVAGYKLYVGAESHLYHQIIDVGNRTTHTVTNLQDDRPYYFAVTAYTSTGGESAHSREVTNAVAMRLLPDDTSLNIDRVNYSRHPALMTYTWPERTPANAALLSFDLSGIPPAALLHRATLRLFLIDSDTIADTNYAVTAHKVVGARPVIGLSTGYTADGATPWNPSACCHRNIPLAQANIAPPEFSNAVDSRRGAKAWTITAMVRDWLADPAANAGLLLNADASAGADRYRYFASMEHPDAALRPALEVEYVVPRRLDATRPSVRITSPSAGAPYATGTISVAAEATDESGIASVRFFVGDRQIGEASGGSYALSWDTSQVSDGTHSLVAVARDAAGNTAVSAPVTVLVANGVVRLSARDTTLNLDATNYSSHPVLMTYTWPERRIANAAVLEFDLSTLPEGAVVHEATLRLTLLESDAAGEPYVVSAHKIVGKDPVIEKATGYTADGRIRWTATECCHGDVPLAQADISPAYDTKAIDHVRGEKVWTLTRMVQEWMADPATNFGVLLNSDGGAAADRFRYFASADHDAPDLRPVLHVVYSMPE
jgi:hypothetical protein